MDEFLFLLSEDIVNQVEQDGFVTRRNLFHILSIRAHQMRHVGLRGGGFGLITAHDLALT